MTPEPDTAVAEPAVIRGSREQLLHLLAEAAEIEHTLMCSYLYAAFSLKRGGDAGLSSDESDAVTRWRKTIMEVAVQEMGHLVLVANLTVALGGRPHFARPNFPVSPGYFPSGVVVRLSGFSAETLDHFIFLERPRGAEGTDSEAYDQDAYQREQTIVGLMPSAQDYETIGHLYEAIRVNVVTLAARIGAERLFVGGKRAQVGPATIDLEGVVEIDSVGSAEAAIDTIIDQGEGSSSDNEESHYRSFAAIRDEYSRLIEANAAFAPAWPVADNPVLRKPPDPADRVYIDDVDAATILDFGCATYGLLLRMLIQCFGRDGPHAVADQERLMSTAIELMHAVGAVGDALATRDASPNAPGIHAGLTFTMLRGAEPLLSGGAESFLLKEALTQLAERIGRLPPVPRLDAARLKALAASFELGGGRSR